MLMSEANKAIMLRFYDEIFNEGKVELIDEIVAGDAIEHEKIPGLDGSGPEVMRMMVTTLRTAFPDIHVEAQDMIAEGDLVATRIAIEGTHQGQFMDLPATGKKIQIEGMDFVRFENGLAKEHWGVTDTLGMFQQLGVIPNE